LSRTLLFSVSSSYKPAAADNLPCCCNELTLASGAVSVVAISAYQTTLRSQLEILWRVSSRRTCLCY